MKRRRVLRALAVAGLGAIPAGMPGAQPPATTFAQATSGPGIPAPWQHESLPGVPANRYRIVDDDGVPMLEVLSQRSASSVFVRFEAPLRARELAWRWRTDAWPAAASSAAVGERAGDDFSLRLYLFFDYPLARLSMADRALLSIARSLRDPRLPAATLCYVADPRGPEGEVWPSPYTGRVRLMRLRADRSPGRWWGEDRDLHADFQRAFGGEHGPGLPAITGVALAADTDQGGGELRSRFADLRWRLAD
jgi:hypothetical protein